MGKKKTYEEVKHYIENEICDWKILKLLSKEYINSQNKLEIEDDEGYKYYLKLSTIITNYNCNNNFEKFSKDNKFTIDNIINWLKINTNGYELISGIYDNANNTYLKFKCPNGHVFDKSWHVFYHNNARCPYCEGNMRYTYDITKNIIENTMSDKYNLIWLDDVYINIKTELNLQDKYGYKYSMTLDNLLTSYDNNMSLNQFSPFNKYTIYNINLWMILNNKTDQLLSDKYINNTKKLTFKCANGHIFKMGWNSYQSNNGCSDCAGNTKKTSEEMKYIIEHKFRQDEQLRVLDENIKNTHSKINLVDKYGYKYYLSYIGILTGINQNGNLRKVGKENPYSIHNINLIIKDSAIGYKLLSNKYSLKKKLKFECPKGHIFRMTWNDFSQGYRCSICRESHGEQKIRYYLLSNNINFESQFKFNDCKYKNCLPFDYAIYNSKGFIECLIEYQGQQHYEPVDFAGKGEKWALNNFIGVQKRDKIKRDYCKNNNIKLIEIPYWVFDNIEEILKKELKNIIEEENLKEVV